MSRLYLKALAPVAALIGAVSAVSPAYAADTTFASYGAANGAFSATIVGTKVKLSEKKAVTFSFLNTNLSSQLNGVAAILTFSAIAPKADYGTATIFGVKFGAQTELQGSFSFKSIKAYKIGSTTYAAGSNLLTVDFAHAVLSGQIGGKTAVFTADTTTNGGIVTYTSDFLTFGNTVSRDFSDSFSALSTNFGGTNSLIPFTATPTGSFASDPVPLSTAVLPEPATWLMMLIGFGSIGLGIRSSARRDLRPA